MSHCQRRAVGRLHLRRGVDLALRGQHVVNRLDVFLAVQSTGQASGHDLGRPCEVPWTGARREDASIERKAPTVRQHDRTSFNLMGLGMDYADSIGIPIGRR